MGSAVFYSAFYEKEPRTAIFRELCGVALNTFSAKLVPERRVKIDKDRDGKENLKEETLAGVRGQSPRKIIFLFIKKQKHRSFLLRSRGVLRSMKNIALRHFIVDRVKLGLNCHFNGFLCLRPCNARVIGFFHGVVY